MSQRKLSTRSVLNKLRRDIPFSFEEADAIEWIAEALEAVGATSQLKERVAFIKVENYECLLPNNLVYIVQIARNNVFDDHPETACCSVVLEEQEEELPTYDFVPIDCNGTPIADYELAYYRPFWDMERDYGVLIGSNWYRNYYTPVRLANSTFFQSLVCSIPNAESLYSPSQDEYTVEDPYLRFSFKEGFVAVAYLCNPLDADGYPLIPDNRAYTEALARYVRYKILDKKYLEGEDVERKLVRAEQDWHWYCKQAANWAMMPKGIDDYQDLQDMQNYILPRMYRYYGYFGRMATPENRLWNNTMTRYAI